MRNVEVFWKYFQATGHIGAYLIFKEINRESHDYVCQRVFRKKRKLG